MTRNTYQAHFCGELRGLGCTYHSPIPDSVSTTITNSVITSKLDEVSLHEKKRIIYGHDGCLIIHMLIVNLQLVRSVLVANHLKSCNKPSASYYIQVSFLFHVPCAISLHLYAARWSNFLSIMDIFCSLLILQTSQSYDKLSEPPICFLHLSSIL